MSTKNNLPSVRFHTAMDAYHYTVDNRPLNDLSLGDDRLGDAIDSEVAAKNLTTLAAGFLCRAVATENTAVGRISYSGYDLTIERAILSQQADASGTDTRDVPWIGLAQDAEVFTITAPSTAATVRPWIIKARVAAVADLPYYDGALPDMVGFNNVRQIDWQLVQGVDQSTAVPIAYPSAGSGWIECLRIRTYDTSSDVNPYLVSYVDFKDEGDFGGGSGGTEFELQKFTTTLLADTDTITGITVNANYGLVFVDGLLQPDVTVLSSSSIQFPVALSIGQTVDVLVTAGGIATVAETSQNRFVFTATTEGQTEFSDPGMDFTADAAIVFVNDKYVPWTGYSFNGIGDTMTLADGVTDGDKVYVFELRTVGVGNPHITGGGVGDVLVKTGLGSLDYEWGSSVGIGGGSEGNVLVKTGPLPTDLDWLSDAAHGTVRLEYVSLTSTVKVVPTGGGGIIIDGVRRVIPSGGVTCAEFTNAGWLSTAVANGFQDATVWMGLSYNALTDVFTLSPYRTSAHSLDWSSLDVPVLSTNSAVTVVGGARLISGVNRVLPFNDSRNALVRSFFGEKGVLASHGSTATPTLEGSWSQIGPGATTEVSGVRWAQAPISSLQSTTTGGNTLYSQVRGLVLPGETYEAGICGAYFSAGTSGNTFSTRLNLSGERFKTDVSGAAAYQPRMWAAINTTGGLSTTGSWTLGKTEPEPRVIMVLPEVDIRSGDIFKVGYYQTTFKVSR